MLEIICNTIKVVKVTTPPGTPSGITFYAWSAEFAILSRVR